MKVKQQRAALAEWAKETRLNGIRENQVKIIHSETSSLEILRPIIESLPSPTLLVWVWTIGIQQSGEISNMIEKGEISGFRAIVDESFKKRLPEADAALRAATNNIRYASTHCKIYLMQGGGRTVSVLSSANLNKNKRYEFYSISIDPKINTYLLAEFEELYGKSNP